MTAISRRWALVAAFAVSVAAPRLAAAQMDITSQLRPPPAGMVQRITLSDGSQLIGKVLTFENGVVRFESGMGVSEIPVGNVVVVKLERPGEMRDGMYFFPNPNVTRLFYAPTGRMLKSGEGYVSDFWIFFPSIAVGITDRLTIGGGISVFPGAGPEEQLLYLTPKVGLTQSERFNTAIGALAISFPDFDEYDTSGRYQAGIVYGVGTWGKPDNSVTAGVGYGYTRDGLADRPILMFGAETRLAPRLSFVTENHVFPGNNIVLSGGLRLMGQGVSVDFGFASFQFADDESFWFPLLGFVFKW